MAEVKAQPVRRIQAAPLRHMIAKRVAQRLMQQVRGRVVGADRAAAVMVDLKLRGLAIGNGAFGHVGKVNEHARHFLGVGDPRHAPFGFQHPGIAPPGHRFSA